MRWFFRRFCLPFYRRWALRQARRERGFQYDGLRLRIPPGVFHPGLYFSTPVFLSFLKNVDFQEKTALDVGTGSGLLALFAAKNGARSTALDLNPRAVATARQNAGRNALPLEVLESDLFAALPPGAVFDFILVNPPYYPVRARDAAGAAFFAGENLEYFERFFAQLPAFVHEKTKTWLILSEDCDWPKICSIAARQGVELAVVFARKKWGERFFVAEARAAGL